jgi:hypothetical protein
MLLSLCSPELTHGEHANRDKSIDRPSTAIRHQNDSRMAMTAGASTVPKET